MIRKAAKSLAFAAGMGIIAVPVNAMEGENLLKAIRNGDCSLVKSLLDQGMNYDIGEPCDGIRSGCALREATRAGQFDMVKLLVERGADVNARSFFPPALVWACELGRLDIAQLLLDHHADVHAGGFYGEDAPLKGAATSGNFELVQLLLEHNAFIHASDGTGPDAALRYAAQHGHTKIVHLLLRKGAHIHGGRNSPLPRAAVGGHTSTVNLLLDWGADIEDGGDTTPLIETARGGRIETAKLLLDRGANINASGGFLPQPSYALWLAVIFGHEKLVKLLIDRGVDMSSSAVARMRISDSDVTDFQIRTARLVLENGACVENGAALRWGGGIGKDVVRLLEFCSSHAFTLFRSNANNFIEEVQKGNQRVHPHQMMLWAVILNNMAVVQKLLALYPDTANAEYTAKDGITMTALMYASLFGFYDIVSLLVENGANIYRTNQQQSDAITLAARFGQYHIAGRLLILQAKNKNLF